MADLTRKIRMADYNEGKPFIPMVELTALIGVPGPWKIVNGHAENPLRRLSFGYNGDFYLADDYHIEYKRFPQSGTQTLLLGRLDAWRFDYRGLIQQNCAVDVNGLSDPYASNKRM